MLHKWKAYLCGGILFCISELEASLPLNMFKISFSDTSAVAPVINQSLSYVFQNDHFIFLKVIHSYFNSIIYKAFHLIAWVCLVDYSVLIFKIK